MAEERLKSRRRNDGTIGLMGHVIADYPSLADARAMIGAMAEAGVEVIEIQIPFSEPMADGPVFLAANHKALARGVDYQRSLDLMAEVTARHPDVDFVFMTYLNVVYKRGYETFVREATAAGARGVILPDLPYEYAGVLDAACRKAAFTNVPLIPPNCAGDRLKDLAGRSESLVYAVARAGVTGAETRFGESLDGFLADLRARTKAAVALGFGIKGPDHVRALRGKADLAVVGTAALSAFEVGGLAGYRKLWRELVQAGL